MRFWFGKKKHSKPQDDSATEAPASSAQDAGSHAAVDAQHAPVAPKSPPPDASRLQPSTLASMNQRMLDPTATSRPPTDALNDRIVQAVQLSNAETAAYAPSQIAIGPNMMISQASGLIAQSAAAYFDGASKLALASQAVLLKQMTENLVENNVEKAAEDALGVLATDILMGAAAAVAAAAGALEAESASFAIDKIDQSISKYAEVMRSRKPAGS